MCRCRLAEHREEDILMSVKRGEYIRPILVGCVNPSVRLRSKAKQESKPPVAQLPNTRREVLSKQHGPFAMHQCATALRENPRNHRSSRGQRGSSRGQRSAEQGGKLYGKTRRDIWLRCTVAAWARILWVPSRGDQVPLGGRITCSRSTAIRRNTCPFCHAACHIGQLQTPEFSSQTSQLFLELPCCVDIPTLVEGSGISRAGVNRGGKRARKESPAPPGFHV